jgi:hypothetical protein
LAAGTAVILPGGHSKPNDSYIIEFTGRRKAVNFGDCVPPSTSLPAASCGESPIVPFVDEVERLAMYISIMMILGINMACGHVQGLTCWKPLVWMDLLVQPVMTDRRQTCEWICYSCSQPIPSYFDALRVVLHGSYLYVNAHVKKLFQGEGNIW